MKPPYFGVHKKEGRMMLPIYCKYGFPMVELEQYSNKR